MRRTRMKAARVMTEPKYSILRAMAAPWMAEPAPEGFHLSRGIPSSLPRCRTCVYITELSDGQCAYVGQTRQGVEARLKQHVRLESKALRWSKVWVAPILDTVSDRALSRIEGRIGAHLKPIDSIRLPRG